MHKNTAGKVAVYAWDTINQEPKTGDAAQITSQYSLDGGACAALADTNPTEVDAADQPGVYLFDNTAAEANGDLFTLVPVSSTDGIRLEPLFIHTRPTISRLNTDTGNRLYRSMAGQKLMVFAWDSIAQEPKTGDAGNISAQISKDCGTAAATNDAAPSELESTDHPGWYYFNMATAETRCTDMVVTPVSSTEGVQLQPVWISMEYYPGTEGYPDDSFLVDMPLNASISTDTVRGALLSASYTEAAALTPGGNAISANNPARLFIHPGRYRLIDGNKITVAVEGMELLATRPEMGGHRQHTDRDKYDNGGTDMNEYRPPPTEIYSDVAGVTPITQSAQKVKMVGFGIGQIADDAGGTDDCHALWISADSNAGSVYNRMYFFHRTPLVIPGYLYRTPVGFAKHADGTWSNCIGNAYAWRVGHDASPYVGQFRARMTDMEAGARSYIGDYEAGKLGTKTASGCRLDRCLGIGEHEAGGTAEPSGYACFGGCNTFGLPGDADCELIDCWAGDRSFFIGVTYAGKLTRCHGGDYCGCSTISAAGSLYLGILSGEAIDSHFGKGSLGSSKPNEAGGKVTGTIRGCTVLGSEEPHRLEGAVVANCLLTMGTTNKDCITLLDDNSAITNSTLLVVEGGTGVPVNAATALSVCAAGNRYNNLAAAAEGLGSNVTNVGTGERSEFRLADGSLAAATFAGNAITAASVAADAAAEIAAAVDLAAAVTILPYASSVANDGSLLARPLTVWQYATGSWTIAIFDDDDVAVDLSAADLAFVAWAESDPTTAVITLSNYNGESDITVGGDDDNQVTITCPDTDTDTAQVLHWRLLNMTTDGDLAQGKLTIHAAPDAPAIVP